MKKHIEIGDRVNISIDSEDHFVINGDVLHIPSATGDCWHVLGTDRNLHYIQQFHVMTLIQPRKGLGL